VKKYSFTATKATPCFAVAPNLPEFKSIAVNETLSVLLLDLLEAIGLASAYKLTLEIMREFSVRKDIVEADLFVLCNFQTIITEAALIRAMRAHGLLGAFIAATPIATKSIQRTSVFAPLLAPDNIPAPAASIAASSFILPSAVVVAPIAASSFIIPPVTAPASASSFIIPSAVAVAPIAASPSPAAPVAAPAAASSFIIPSAVVVAPVAAPAAAVAASSFIIPSALAAAPAFAIPPVPDVSLGIVPVQEAPKRQRCEMTTTTSTTTKVTKNYVDGSEVTTTETVSVKRKSCGTVNCTHAMR
jgi:hypothetical protein